MFVAWASSFSGGQALPEVGDAEGAVGTLEGSLQTLYLIEVSGNNVDTELGQLCRLPSLGSSLVHAR